MPDWLTNIGVGIAAAGAGGDTVAHIRLTEIAV